MTSIEMRINDIKDHSWSKLFDLIPLLDVVFENPNHISRVSSKLLEVCINGGFVLNYPWYNWKHCKSIKNDLNELKNESLINLLMLLTFLIRSSRFIENGLLSYIENRFILNIIKTLKIKKGS